MVRIFLLLFSFMLSYESFAQQILYLSPNGSDKNQGGFNSPLKTIGFAKTRARKINGPVEIRLRKGTYYLSQPVVFDSSDSRSATNRIVFKAMPNEHVVVSSAAVLNLNWKPYKNGIMQAKVTGDFIFDQLFVNGKPQRMARYPNYRSSERILGGTAPDAASAERAKRWSNPSGGYLHALHLSEWGGFSYLIKGKNEIGEPVLEGGWQNNRKMGMHPTYRFVENIFEELDTCNEWYYNKLSKTLYYYPPKGLNLNAARIETPQLKHIFEFRGTKKQPISNISIQDIEITHTLRTFMENKEPLLRSDWTTYRGGAVVFEGATNCSVKNCFFNTVGGNAVYFSYYNRGNEVIGCHILKAGGSGVSFVGDPKAVRSPSFEYNEFINFKDIDREPGPKTDNYPAKCKVYDNLIEQVGQTEIQSAGVQISMSMDICISHNTICNLPRAGINISEGTWGGHIIEYNDVFNTVNESGDHGSFNSWGRDRYWHPDKATLDTIVEKHPEIVLLDVIRPIILRNNRFRCDHGWDIDLDDGSSRYEIYNNLLLNGGLKFREGYNRKAENNIIINNTFHPHVWFNNSGDIFRRNIIFRNYAAIGMPGNGHWGKEIDFNVFTDKGELSKAQVSGRDKHSVYAPPAFVDPVNGNYRLKEGSEAFKVGFKNFDMEHFGVESPKLKSIAPKVLFPTILFGNLNEGDSRINYLGLELKDLNSLGERSATGMAKETGILVLKVDENSPLKKYVKVNDVLLAVNEISTARVADLQANVLPANFKGSIHLALFRNQREISITAVIE
ncbi:peptide-binding protein [Pedobacter sp. BG31]|uniref:peptide-binding protein n=1 Tax=Pedobacter sp. BG31 TaxID=3349697 RepID=UPI0035F39F02